MNVNHDHSGLSGGFSRPEFTPGPGAQTPRVNADLAAIDGTHLDQAVGEDARHQERSKANKNRRRQLWIAVATIAVVIAVIVAGMIWFWASDPYLTEATAISTV